MNGSDEAHDNAMIVKVSEDRLISTNTPGAFGWHLQLVTQLEDEEIPTVLALTDLITGSDSNYTLVSYFYNAQKDLLACAHFKQHDDDTTATYYDLLKDVALAKAAAENDDVAAAGDEAAVEGTSSGSKVGLFVFLSAFAAVGIAAVLGDVFAL